ncbi:MAG: DUF6110 family protein [Synergistaceae bacterium]|jgi:hypothetical protein|nr:DUF6110 family protein [Synergistaceae bacterium]
MFNTKAWIFAAGVLAGAGAVCFVKSGAGRKTAVALTRKGLELRECVAKNLELAREAADDIAAEARQACEKSEPLDRTSC